MKVKIKKLHHDAVTPTYATKSAACFDLTATERHGDVFGTGLAIEVPDGYGLFIFSRSGHGFKDATRLANCVGVIDADYRGEIKIKLTRDDGGIVGPMIGERIAQGVLLPTPQVEFEEVDELEKTERGMGGFGSTG